jgi:hypothetical protein
MILRAGLTVPELQAVFDRAAYKPGWKFTVFDSLFEGPHLHIECRIENAYTPGKMADLCIESPLPPMKTDEDVLAWLFWRLQRIEIHEVREWLLFDGQRRFDPHDGVDRT